jgi:hypothetical protein
MGDLLLAGSALAAAVYGRRMTQRGGKKTAKALPPRMTKKGLV